MNEVFICDAVRTPFGRYGGALSSVRTDDLATLPIKALMERNAQVDWGALDDVIDLYARDGRLISDGSVAGDGAQSPYRSMFITGFSISASEKTDLIEFLRALTDNTFLSEPRFAPPDEE